MLANSIKNRRAVFPGTYVDTPISKEEINMVLEAANWAPTHRRTEPWRFKVFHSETSRTALSTFLGNAYAKSVATISEFKQQKMMAKPLQSGCVIAICMQRDAQEGVPEWEEIAATAMAVQNMWLMAQELQIGAYWSSPKLISYFGEHLPLAEGERCLGFFYMGKIEGTLPEGTRKSSIEEKVVWV